LYNLKIIRSLYLANHILLKSLAILLNVEIVNGQPGDLDANQIVFPE
jgi:hypothetical protein